MFDHNNLEIDQREREDIVILDLKGHLVLGASDTALREAVQSLFDHGNRQLILNLGGVSSIDTVGGGALLFLAEEYRGAGGKLVLFQLAHTHGELYEMARLEAVVEIYGDELSAVNSFFPDRAVAHYDILDYIEHSEHQPEPEKNK
jgi:anti-sigma B factor antagonist